jgi:hypothetical protein
MMTILYVWAVLSFMTMVALRHEVGALRKTLQINAPWKPVSIIILFALGALFPVGLMYLWAVMRRNASLKEWLKTHVETQEAG